ncbi:hypothetical protein [Methanoculleus chikugoensis]|uniref:hypothetical protein n=1 Tax=Methanoculleus chikugoensis TaxID=118126 RepID=UPI001FB33BEA|nr:hypothetical protein [Methanoculleus chikugoensis]
MLGGSLVHHARSTTGPTSSAWIRRTSRGGSPTSSSLLHEAGATHGSSHESLPPRHAATSYRPVTGPGHGFPGFTGGEVDGYYMAAYRDPPSRAAGRTGSTTSLPLQKRRGGGAPRARHSSPASPAPPATPADARRSRPSTGRCS